MEAVEEFLELRQFIVLELRELLGEVGTQVREEGVTQR